MVAFASAVTHYVDSFNRKGQLSMDYLVTSSG